MIPRLSAQSQYRPGFFLFVFPPFQRLPRNRAKLLLQLRPVTALIKPYELLLARPCKTVLTLPAYVLRQQIGLGQCVSPALVVAYRRAVFPPEIDRSFGGDKGGLHFRIMDGKAGGLGHGGGKPLVPAPPSLTLAGLPVFALSPFINGLPRYIKKSG